MRFVACTLISVIIASSGTAWCETLSTEQKLTVLESESRAAEARAFLQRAERKAAIEAALAALPQGLSDQEYTTHFLPALRVLYDSMRSRSMQLPLSEFVHFAVSPDGTRAVTGSMRIGGDTGQTPREPTRLWNTDTGDEIAQLKTLEESFVPGYTMGVPTFSPDGTLIVQGIGETGEVRIWSAQDGKVVRSLHSGSSSSFTEFTSDNRYLVADAYDVGGMKAWDIASGNEVLSVPYNSCSVPMPVQNPSSSLIWYAEIPLSGDGCELVASVLSYDPTTGSTKVILRNEEIGVSQSATFSEDGKFILLTLGDGTAVAFDVATGAEIVRIPSAKAAGAEMRFSPDGRFLLGRPGYEFKVVAFTIDTGAPADLIPLGQLPVINVVAGPDGSVLGWDESRLPQTYDRDLSWGSALINRALDTVSDDARARISAIRPAW